MMNRNIMKNVTLLILVLMVVFMGSITTYAMGGSERSVASCDNTIQSLLGKQSYSLRSREQIMNFYRHIMRNSSWKPKGYFPFGNDGSYQYTISDNVYTYNAGGAKGCMLYSQFVSGIVYGKHRNIKTSASSTTANGIKELIKNHAQFGEHIRVDSTHSVTFIAADDSGFYGTEYWSKDSSIHLVYYTYSNFASQAGSKAVWIYDIDTTVNQDDNMMPSIQNVKVVGRSKNGYILQCFVNDNVGVSKVQFPTWKSSQTSAGCTWYDGYYMGDGIWQFGFVNALEEGYYTTHIYAWDAAGNYASTGIEVFVDRTPPCISNVSVVETTAEGYRIRCTVTDNYEVDRVQFPTWTGYNGQDDIQLNWTTDVGARGVNCGNNVYEYYVKRSEHNEEFGQYATHIYAYDKTGNRTFYDAGIINLENVGPVISDVKVISKSEEGYTITCKVTDDQSGVTRVQFPTWTKKDWQDDLNSSWTTSSKVSAIYLGNGIYSYTVKRSEHNDEYGIYYTDIYAFDGLNNMSFGGGVVVDIQQKSLPKDLENNKETPATPNSESDNNNPAVSDSQNNPPAVGTVIICDGVKYKVAKNGDEGYVQCIGPVSKKITKATIKAYVFSGKYKYPVCQIKSSAFKNCKKLKTVVVGENMKIIGTNAFCGCKKLKSITIKSKKLQAVKSKAFKGIYKKAKINVPKGKKTKYKKMLKKAGIKSTAIFK